MSVWEKAPPSISLKAFSSFFFLFFENYIFGVESEFQDKVFDRQCLGRVKLRKAVLILDVLSTVM